MKKIFLILLASLPLIASAGLYCPSPYELQEGGYCLSRFNGVQCAHGGEEVIGAGGVLCKIDALSMQDFSVEAESQRFKDQCFVENQKASECCMYPERCFKSVDGKNEDNEGLGGQVFQMLMGTAVSLPASGIAQMCGRMKDISNVMTAVNGYLGYKCGQYVKQCKDTCQESYTQFKNDYAQFGPNGENLETLCSSRNTATGYSQVCNNYRLIKTKYEDAMAGCGAMNNRSQQMMQQALASQLASKFADQCKAQAQVSPEDPFDGDGFNADCTNPANLSKPACISLCTRPENATQPACQAYLAQMRNGGEDPFANNNNNRFGNNLFNNVPDGDVEKQVPLFNDVEAKGTNVNAANGAGGGGGLPGGGDSGGLNGGGGGGAGGDSGYDTDIENGMRAGGGSGFSTVRGMASTSFGGGSGGGAKPKSILSKPFNLKEFLPFGKKANPATPIRGLASVTKEIGPASGDIFKKVTDRFFQVCLRDALYDCSTLKKGKGGGL